MLTAANAEACAQPHWRVIAAGFDTERWFADNQAVGTAGIANPQPTRLPAGQYDYRFTSSRSNSRASTDDVGRFHGFRTWRVLAPAPLAAVANVSCGRDGAAWHVLHRRVDPQPG
ncbi:MAG: hypothetical protein KBF65_02040 [Rubrivivax sp.]|jgi:hypothetical protein|nr:hypothetical protein [Betaproteobacteria bacterium]MBP6317461.1 hypothetical protein [Rubrivivax sp.]MBK7458182.1 hypothetical protein [Betaproteobacteria bacterium]MBK8107338.1 hypothetical protein [Betaproteobacteria bacterium]MBL0299454.1 hypothetical protein [Betaproteobacteria bacterium]